MIIGLQGGGSVFVVILQSTLQAASKKVARLFCCDWHFYKNMFDIVVIQQSGLDLMHNLSVPIDPESCPPPQQTQ